MGSSSSNTPVTKPLILVSQARDDAFIISLLQATTPSSVLHPTTPASNGNNLKISSGVAGTRLADLASTFGTIKSGPPTYPCFRYPKKCCSATDKGICNYRDCHTFF